MVILESTGHYHLPITRFLEDHNFLFVVVNPILSYQAKKSSTLRKVKTDAVDAYALCELFYKEDFEHYKTRGVQLLNLRNLTRQHDAITGLYIQIKLQFQAVLDQVFPEYKGVFGDLHSTVSLKILLEFPTSDAVLNAGKAKISEKIASLCMRRSEKWATDKAETLQAAAERNPFRKAPFQSHLISLEMYVSMLLHYREHLTALEKQMDPSLMKLRNIRLSNRSPVSEKKSLQRLSRKSERLIGLITQRSWLPLQALTRAFISLGSSRPQLTESRNVDPTGFAIPYSWPYFVAYDVPAARK